MYWDDLKEIARIFLCLLAAILGLTLVAARVGNELSLPANIARIEQLRTDAARTALGANEDVIGQVTAWNQKIRANQRYRTLWYGRLAVPAGWEQVKVIEVAPPTP